MIDENEIVEIEVALGTLSITKKELRVVLEDLEFLKDAFLVMLNPEVTEKSWDMGFDKKTTIKLAKEMFDNSSYNQDFINKCFEGKM